MRWILLGCAALCLAVEPVRVGNLMYAGDKTSVCFSDRYLTTVAVEAGVPTAKRMETVRLADAASLGRFAFVVMNGQEEFTLTEIERTNLKRWLEAGGFLLASAGCSSQAWGASLARELEGLFGAAALADLPPQHPVFATLFRVPEVSLSHGGTGVLRGLTLGGRLAAVFSPEGLNDTQHTQGCCCCGGNEVKLAEELVSNILCLALTE